MPAEPRHDRWRIDQVTSVVAHAIDEGGAGVRLLTHIALQSQPDDPWVHIHSSSAAAMFTTRNRAAGSKLITRMSEKGLIVEDHDRAKRTLPRRIRLNLRCNALCREGEHVLDTITATALEPLGITEPELADLLEGLAADSPALERTYRRLLLDIARPGQPPQSSPVADARAGLELVARGLIREHNSNHQPRYLPVPVRGDI